jgi:hypothetical protein
MSAVLKQKFLSGDENLCATPALWLASAILILKAVRSTAPRRMIQEAAPAVHSGARFETRRLAAPLLSTRGWVRSYPLSGGPQ